MPGWQALRPMDQEGMSDEVDDIPAWRGEDHVLPVAEATDGIVLPEQIEGVYVAMTWYARIDGWFWVSR